jgi:hypothetical protein
MPQKFVSLVHLAACLKRFITILLLMLMIEQSTGMLNRYDSGIITLQDMEDKKEQGVKEEKKEKKDFIFTSMYIQASTLVPRFYCVMPQLLVTHPVMDHLTPPPDGVFLS